MCLYKIINFQFRDGPYVWLRYLKSLKLLEFISTLEVRRECQKRAWACIIFPHLLLPWKFALESPLVSKEITPVNPKENQPWIFIGRTAAEAEALILWPSDVKSQLTGKDLGAGKHWGQEENGAAEDEMAGWHNYWHNGHEFEQILGVSEGKGSLVCYSS